MGSKRIPISEACSVGKKHGQQQVIIVTWDADTGTTHVVTWGETKEACRQAARGGDLVKKALGW